MNRRGILKSLLPAVVAVTVAPMVQPSDPVKAEEPEPMSDHETSCLISPEQHLRPYFPDLSDKELTKMLNHEIMGPIRFLPANTGGVFVDFQPGRFQLPEPMTWRGFEA